MLPSCVEVRGGARPREKAGPRALRFIRPRHTIMTEFAGMRMQHRMFQWINV